MYLVPNVIDADVFDFQAAVEETTLTGKRYTWRRHGGSYGATPGTVVTAKPELHFPYPVGVNNTRVGRRCLAGPARAGQGQPR